LKTMERLIETAWSRLITNRDLANSGPNGDAVS